jgi:hypothetical protein
MKPSKIEKLETIRICFEDNLYCDVTPDAEDPNLRSFIFGKKGYEPEYYFSCKVADLNEAVKIAADNVYIYLEDLVDSGLYDERENSN